MFKKHERDAKSHWHLLRKKLFHGKPSKCFSDAKHHLHDHNLYYCDNCFCFPKTWPSSVYSIQELKCCRVFTEKEDLLPYLFCWVLISTFGHYLPFMLLSYEIHTCILFSFFFCFQKQKEHVLKLSTFTKYFTCMWFGDDQIKGNKTGIIVKSTWWLESSKVWGKKFGYRYRNANLDPLFMTP